MSIPGALGGRRERRTDGASVAGRISALVIGAAGSAICQSMIEHTVFPSVNCCRTVNEVTIAPASRAIAR